MKNFIRNASYEQQLLVQHLIVRPNTLALVDAYIQVAWLVCKKKQFLPACRVRGFLEQHMCDMCDYYRNRSNSARLLIYYYELRRADFKSGMYARRGIFFAGAYLNASG